MSDPPEGYISNPPLYINPIKGMEDHQIVDLALKEYPRINHEETIKALCLMMNRGFKYMDEMQEKIDELEKILDDNGIYG